MGKGVVCVEVAVEVDTAVYLTGYSDCVTGFREPLTLASLYKPHRLQNSLAPPLTEQEAGRGASFRWLLAGDVSVSRRTTERAW